MRTAIVEAQAALARDEIPVGAVVVCGDKIIARAHNLVETLCDATAHAEMQALTAAANFMGSKYLGQCTLYVTLEPCAMCAAAMFWTQLGALVYGATDLKRGYSIVSKTLLHPTTDVMSGILAEECGTMVTDFFKQKRLRTH
jgi:tRNA(adenine34) deaminase